jgi:phosphotriesterase-related protein
MGTGWYQSAWHPEGLSQRSVAELTAEVVRDIERGVGDTGIRAGIIGEVSAMYVSLDPEESTEARALRAAARASRMTGAALSVHQWIRDGKMLELSLQIIEEEGADLGRVILGHIDAVSAQNLDRLKLLMDRGLTLEFDLFGTPYFLDRPALDDRPMADAIIALVKAGYGDRILMSHDVCTKLQQSAYGGKGFTYVQKEVVPYLLAHGLTAEDVHTIQVANPRRLLTIRDRQR